MRIGLFAPLGNPFASPDYLNTLGPAAEARGFHSLWVAEHVVLFDQYASRYPYAADGRIPAGGESGILEPFNALTFLAASTSQLRLSLPRAEPLAVLPRPRDRPRPAAQPGLHREGGRRGRLALERAPRLRRRRRLARRGVRGLRRPLRAPRRAHPRLPRRHAGAVDPADLVLPRRVLLLRAAAPVPEAAAAAAPADPLRRRERRRVAPRRRSGSGLVRLWPPPRRRAGSPGAPRPLPGAGRSQAPRDPDQHLALPEAGRLRRGAPLPRC